MAVWSEITTKDIFDSKLRLDADFYKPEFIETKEIVSKSKHLLFKDLISVLTDYHANGSYETLSKHVTLYDEPNYAYVVRTTDLETNNFKNDVKYFDEHAYNYLSKSKVFGGEIIINKIGSAGKTYLMPNLNKPVSLGMNQFMIRCKDEELTKYIYAYLISSYGATLLKQQINGTVPFTITKDGVRNVLIPVPSKNEITFINKCISNYLIKLEDSQALYEKAEGLLETKLGLDEIVFSTPKSDIASFSEIVKNKRIDADFYQLKFKQLEEHISKQKTKALASICSFQKGVEVGTKLYTEEGPAFIRVSNLTVNGFTFGNSDKHISVETYNTYQNIKPRKGDILLTKDGTIGTCYVVDEEVQGIISGGILILKLKQSSIPQEYLALVINSKICQMQAERDCSGALITHWKPEQIRKMKIPILRQKEMEQLADLVIESKAARKESEELLEIAKKRVEYLIETEASS